MVADHHIRFMAIKVPQRKSTTLFVELQESLYHIIHPFRIGIGKQRMSRTVSIPQREGRIVIPTVRFMDLVIGTIIRAIDITEDSRGDHRMIDSCIELNQVVGIISIYFDLRQFFVPAGNRLFMILIKIIQGNFRL